MTKEVKINKLIVFRCKHFQLAHFELYSNRSYDLNHWGILVTTLCRIIRYPTYSRKIGLVFRKLLQIFKYWYASPPEVQYLSPPQPSPPMASEVSQSSFWDINFPLSLGERQKESNLECGSLCLICVRLTIPPFSVNNCQWVPYVDPFSSTCSDKCYCPPYLCNVHSPCVKSCQPSHIDIHQVTLKLIDNFNYRSSVYCEISQLVYEVIKKQRAKESLLKVNKAGIKKELEKLNKSCGGASKF